MRQYIEYGVICDTGKVGLGQMLLVVGQTVSLVESMEGARCRVKGEHLHRTVQRVVTTTEWEPVDD